jgi:monoamine oxidase
MTIHDVVIVGAGMAGLWAAHMLRQRGQRVVVLEARERVGGRLLSETVGGERLDLGGQWLGPRQPRLARLAKQLGVSTFPQYHHGVKLLSWGGKLRRFRGEVPWLSPLVMWELWRLEKTLDRYAATLPPEAPWKAPSALAWDSQTLESWKQQRLWSQGAKLFLDLVTRAVTTSEPRDLSFLYFLAYLRWGHGLHHLISIPGGAQEARFVGGAQQLAEKLAAQLGAAVRLGQPVLALRQSANHVEAVTPGGAVTARRAIVAIPPLLAGRIHYDPPLPCDRDALTSRMPMGSVIKYLAIYERPFWRDAGHSGEVFSDSGPTTTTFDDCSADGRHAALVTFSDGAAARTWGARSPQERQSAVLAELVRFFGPQAGQPLTFAEKDWCADPWSRGCYAGILGPGVLTSVGAALRSPCGRIHWAGTETATEWMGYIEGALQSAERVADETAAAEP